MARAAKILHNLNSVSEMVGALEGMVEGLETAEYLNSLMVQAHAEEKENFDVVTAATAATDTSLSHAYEYGTANITRGDVKHANPTAPSARLYVHAATGTGKRLEVSYFFRDAVTPNPPMDTDVADVDPEVLSKLHNHTYVFEKRAFIMETGERVDVQPIRHDMIFIPSTEHFKVNNEKGFIFAPSGTPTPGRRRKGKFNQWWMSYWSTIAPARVQANIEDRVETDVLTNINSELSIANMNAGKLTVPNPRQSFAAYNKGRNRSKRAMEFAIRRGQMSATNSERMEVNW